jgi:hypothetical protein
MARFSRYVALSGDKAVWHHPAMTTSDDQHNASDNDGMRSRNQLSQQVGQIQRPAR